MKYTEGLSIFCPFDSGAQFMISAQLEKAMKARQVRRCIYQLQN